MLLSLFVSLSLVWLIYGRFRPCLHCILLKVKNIYMHNTSTDIFLWPLRIYLLWLYLPLILSMNNIMNMNINLYNFRNISINNKAIIIIKTNQNSIINQVLTNCKHQFKFWIEYFFIFRY